MKIPVYVIQRTDRKNYVAQWVDPTTGKIKHKSTGTANRREADKYAGQLQAKLEAGELIDTARIEWQILADRYRDEYLSGKAARTRFKFRAVRAHVERLINPKYANVLTSSKISQLQGLLRAEGMAEATIKSSLSSLRACLNWGKKVEVLNRVPAFIMPTRTDKSKGRPLTPAEFNQMLAIVDDPQHKIGHAETVKDFMWGLWLSSLRIEEALRLTWEPTPDGLSLETDAKGVIRLRIEANRDKSTEVRLLPLALDFQRFLQSTPVEHRRGFVFNPSRHRQKTARIRPDAASKLISRIGELAKIQVAIYSPVEGETEPRIKFASAHDLRRSFADRWTDTVSEDQLKELMRHRDIETTRQFYAKQRAERVEQSLNEAMQRNSDISSDIIPFRKTG